MPNLGYILMSFMSGENMKKDKLVAFEVWGCQMNVADGERMLRLLEPLGYSLTEDTEKADLIVLHTCSIREKARHKLVSRLGVIRALKEKNPDLLIVVTGCVVQSEGESLARECSFVDIMLGAYQLGRIREAIAERRKSGDQVVWIKKDDTENGYGYGDRKDPCCGEGDRKISTISGKNEVTRFVNIVQGCNNYCSYCIVPYARGQQRSSSESDILSYCDRLIESGAREIMLLGQNVNSYGLDTLEQRKNHKGRLPFAELLDKVCSKDVERVRFTTSNPYDFCTDIVEEFSKHQKLGRYIHLPVQSGSDTVLKAMNRRITASEYIEKVSWLRALDPSFAVSTDLIVGFPGETDEDFEATCELVKKIGYSFVFSFKYSPRLHTKAALMPDQIPEEVKEKRLAILNGIQDKITLRLNQEEIGKVRTVLFNYESGKEPGVYYGRDEYFRLIRVKSKIDLVSRLEQVKITAADKTALEGVLI